LVAIEVTSSCRGAFEPSNNLLFPDAAGDDELDVAIENLILQIAMWLEGNEEEDEVDEDREGQWGGSRRGRAPNKNKNFARADELVNALIIIHRHS
jgi:hypothetical protein